MEVLSLLQGFRTAGTAQHLPGVSRIARNGSGFAVVSAHGVTWADSVRGSWFTSRQVRDNRVKQGLNAMRIACDTFNADLLYEPWETYNTDCRAFTNFEAYWNKARRLADTPPSRLHPQDRSAACPPPARRTGAQPGRRPSRRLSSSRSRCR